MLRRSFEILFRTQRACRLNLNRRRHSRRIAIGSIIDRGMQKYVMERNNTTNAELTIVESGMTGYDIVWSGFQATKNFHDRQATLVDRNQRKSDKLIHAVLYRKNMAAQEMTDLSLGFICSCKTTRLYAYTSVITMFCNVIPRIPVVTQQRLKTTNFPITFVLLKSYSFLFFLNRHSLTPQEPKSALRISEQSFKVNNFRTTLQHERAASITFRGHAAQLRHKADVLHLQRGPLGDTSQKIVAENITGNSSCPTPKRAIKYVNHKRGSSNIGTTIRLLYFGDLRLRDDVFQRLVRRM